MFDKAKFYEHVISQNDERSYTLWLMHLFSRNDFLVQFQIMLTKGLSIFKDKDKNDNSFLEETMSLPSGYFV